MNTSFWQNRVLAVIWCAALIAAGFEIVDVEVALNVAIGSLGLVWIISIWLLRMTT